MKKGDIFLIAVLLILAGIAYFGITIYQNASTLENGKAVVYVNGQKHSEYPLYRNSEVKIELDDGSYNTIVIENGYADVTEASCPDKICAKHRKINKNGQTITCLPNKLVVQIENGEESELDGVSQ